MAKRILRYIILAGVFSLPLLAWAQGDSTPSVRAYMTPDSISIGDHIRLRVEVDKDMMQMVDFPAFKDNKLGDRIVIIRDEPADTLAGEGRRQKIIKEYLLTCFDAGIYGIGTFPVLYADKNIIDTLYSADSLHLTVTTFEVDTLANTIIDIKRPEEAPLLVSEFSGFLQAGVIILCILAAIIWLIVRAVSRRQPAEKQVYKPRELPHVRAIRELEGLNNKKLWQNDKHKLYYTHLTDIVRTYLEGRYGIGAMEMTSDEIMSAIKDTGLNVKNIDDLGELLYSADLVKFAKHVPDAETNEKVWYDAFYFVEDTKEAPIEKGAALDDNADTGNYSDTPDEK